MTFEFMIKVDFHQLWSEFNTWLRHNMIYEHKINMHEQQLNRYGEYGYTNSYSDQMKDHRSDFWLLYCYAIDLNGCQPSKNLV